MYSVGDLIRFKREGTTRNGHDTVVIDNILQGTNNAFGSHKSERLIEGKTYYFAFGPCVNNEYKENDVRIIRSDNWRFWEKIA